MTSFLPSAPAIIKKVKVNYEKIAAAFAGVGYNLSFPESNRYPLAAKCISQNPKAKKALFHYGYRNESEMIKSLEVQFNYLKRSFDEKEARKIAEQVAKKNFKNPYEVGQVLYNSWGYEQTNVDFYQVIEVKEKSVVIRPIAGALVPSEGFSSMAGKIKPVPDSFTGAPMVKAVKVSVYDGQIRYSVPSKHGAMNIYDSNKNGLYCSWYA